MLQRVRSRDMPGGVALELLKPPAFSLQAFHQVVALLNDLADFELEAKALSVKIVICGLKGLCVGLEFLDTLSHCGHRRRGVLNGLAHNDQKDVR